MIVRRSQLDWLLEAAALAALLAILYIVAAHWRELPDRIPSHFTITGQPNAWGSKNGMWLLPAIGLFLYVTFTMTCFFPERFNVPKGIDKRSPAVQALLIQMMIVMKLVTLLLFVAIEQGQISVALGEKMGLNPMFVITAVVLMFGVTMFYLWRLRKFQMVPG